MIPTKRQILDKISKSEHFARREAFSFRVCKLMRDGEFDTALQSAQLTHLLNEGPGKKIKPNNLTALMEPLLREDIVKIKLVGKGRNKKKYWFPAWIDKKKIENNTSLSGFLESKTLFVSGSNAWTDSNKTLPKIIAALKGNLCIVDPYYGNGTFHTLEKFGKTRKVRFLSAQLGSDEQKKITNFNINLKQFKREFRNIQLKKYNNFWELHDRYIIADNALVVVGYGIKDFGDKESFVVFLPKKEVSNFLPFLKSVFEKRWKQSSYIA